MPQVAAPTTLVMDLEGSDGRERGEDDTSFERQVGAGRAESHSAATHSGIPAMLTRNLPHLQ